MINRRLTLAACGPLAFLTSSVSYAYGAASATAATTPVATGSGATSVGSLLQALFGLVVVLALLAGCAWLLRRFTSTKTQGGANIRIVGGVSVGTRERVMVVEVGNQWVVVGVAAGRVTALSTMPKQDIETSPAGDTPAPSPNFSNWLAQKLDKRNVS